MTRVACTRLHFFRFWTFDLRAKTAPKSGYKKRNRRPVRAVSLHVTEKPHTQEVANARRFIFITPDCRNHFHLFLHSRGRVVKGPQPRARSLLQKRDHQEDRRGAGGGRQRRARLSPRAGEDSRTAPP